MPFNLQGVPTDAEVWLVGNTYWLVWFVPNSDPPVPMVWRVPSSADRQALGITGVDRTLTTDQFNATGALNMGTTTDIPDPGEGVHPFDALTSQFEDEIAVRPYLADPEILALWAESAIEGRLVTEAEMQQTEWWRIHTAIERRWIVFNVADPATAQVQIDDNRLQVERIFDSAGVDNASVDLIRAVADNWTNGKWSEVYATNQIRLLADPLIEGILDPILRSFSEGLNTTRQGEQAVRDLVNLWVGPAVADGWTDTNIAIWANRFRENSDAQIELTDILKQQRLALFPEYENPNLTYEDIAAPWRGVFQQIWGQRPDELDPLFMQIVKLNDLGLATQLLRKKGLDVGNAQVTTDFLGGISDAFGGAVRRINPAASGRR